jgi:hypothetical protein
MEKTEIEKVLDRIDIVGNGEVQIGTSNYDVFESRFHIFVIKNNDEKVLQLPYKTKEEFVNDFKKILNKEVVFLDDMPYNEKEFEEDYDSDDFEPENNPDHREGWDYQVKQYEDMADREYNQEMFDGGE